MDDKVSCNGGRRLPPWMLAAQNPPHAQDLNNYNYNNNSNNESKDDEIDNRNLIKVRSKPSEKISKRNLKLLMGCEERMKRRKRSDCGFAVDGNGEEIPKPKRNRCGRKESCGKANRACIDSDDEETENDEDSNTNTCDDLTVEDLMSIAEECVNEDSEARQRSSLLKDDLTVEDLMSIAKEYVKEDAHFKGKYESKDKSTAEREVQCGPVYNADKYSKRLLQKEEVDSWYLLNENVTSEETIVKPTMSGDPTQDMLDLFLGPLLRKPKNEEKKLNVIAQDLSLACEVQKEKQGVAAPGAEAAPLTKKKSSLKDKVGMFLD